jgi:hypothetical protein
VTAYATPTVTLEEQLEGITDAVLGVMDERLTTGDDTSIRMVRELLCRGRDLWSGFRVAAAGPSEASAQVILRALTELSVTVPWLILRPDVFIELWKADHSARTLSKRELLEQAAIGQGIDPALLAALWEQHEQVLQQVQQLVEERRAAGDQLPWVRLDMRKYLPGLSARAEATRKDHIVDLYAKAYSMYSDWTHSGFATFIETEEVTDGGDELRREGVAAFLILVDEVGTFVGAGVTDRALAVAQELNRLA